MSAITVYTVQDQVKELQEQVKTLTGKLNILLSQFREHVTDHVMFEEVTDEESVHSGTVQGK